MTAGESQSRPMGRFKRRGSQSRNAKPRTNNSVPATPKDGSDGEDVMFPPPPVAVGQTQATDRMVWHGCRVVRGARKYEPGSSDRMDSVLVALARHPHSQQTHLVIPVACAFPPSSQSAHVISRLGIQHYALEPWIAHERTRNNGKVVQVKCQ